MAPQPHHLGRPCSDRPARGTKGLGFASAVASLLVGCSEPAPKPLARPAPAACPSTFPPRACQEVEAWPPCVRRAPNGRLDLVKGCADGVCLGAPARDVPAKLPLGMTVELEKDRVYYLNFDSTYDGTTRSGIGVGVSARCFLEDLGWPENVFAHGGYGKGLVHTGNVEGRAVVIALRARAP